MFHEKRLNYTAINLCLQKLSAITIAKFTISTRTHFTLLTSVKQLRVILVCSASTPDCGHENSNINLIGMCFVRKESDRVNFASTRKLLNLSTEAIVNVRKARLCARCAIFLSKIKELPFFVIWLTSALF